MSSNDAVRILDLNKPSEVLFNIDRVAYQDLLSRSESDEFSEENPTDNKTQVVTAMNKLFTESVIEQVALAWLESIEYSAVFDPI